MNNHPPRTTHDEDSESIISRISYVLVLGAWWREITLGTLLVAIGCVVSMQAIRILLPQYETWADVALLPVASSIAIDTTYTTGVTGDDSKGRWRRIQDKNARRAAFVGLVRSGSVAQATTDRLRGKLYEKDISAATLLERVDAKLATVGPLSLRNTSDLIRITVRDDSPEKAAALATAWAEVFVAQVNHLYKGAPENQLTTILAEEQRTQKAYDVAQKRLEKFLVNSSAENLESTLRTVQEALASLYALKQERFRNILLSKEQDLERQSQAVNLLVETQYNKLAETYALQRNLERVLMNAVDLRNQIDKEGKKNTPSNFIPLLLIKTEAYASSTRLPESLDISIDDLTQVAAHQNDFLADIGGVISTLQDRLDQINISIDEQTKILASGSSIQSLGESDNDTESFLEGRDFYDIDVKSAEVILNGGEDGFALYTMIKNMEKQVQMMKGAIETEKAMQNSLTQNRDVQQAALRSLQNEAVELKLAMAAFTSEVRVASPALVPTRSIYPSVLLTASLGGTAGLLAMLPFVFSLNFRGIPPFLEQWRATRSKQNEDVG